jgi:hypothetical protein
MKRTHFHTLFVVAVLGTMTLIGNVLAAEAVAAPAATSTTETRKAPGTSGSTDRMTPEMERAIESGDAAQVRKLMNELGLSAGSKPPTHYECAGTICTCAGLMSCASMALAGACKSSANCVGEICNCTAK